MIPSAKDAAILNPVNTPPSNASVARIESTPVTGVVIRKARVGALAAPDWRAEAATGSTPQEHRGSGIPTKVALVTQAMLSFPMNRVIMLGGRNEWSIPPIKNPRSRYGPICAASSQKDFTSK
jgi:hypothetical protein